MERDNATNKKLAAEANDTAAREKATRLETERKAEITAAIAAQPLREGVAGLAFKAVQGDVRYAEDGTLVGGPQDAPVPAADYIQSFFERDGAIFLRSQAAGGSGNGAAAPPRGGIQLEDIKPGMTSEQRKNALAQISVLGQ
jgi:hypothetical protein